MWQQERTCAQQPSVLVRTPNTTTKVTPQQHFKTVGGIQSAGKGSKAGRLNNCTLEPLRKRRSLHPLKCQHYRTQMIW
jgi:hypothetical protein